ncbi:MAG: hypothetical protein IJC11_01760 [Alphaproteobacteria bacterium]|nr:hypothetical protein [Alphaproteobacteria bacterium]MBQ6854610.1 hypothetical protein [Alphaproteobacteria bacterium]
MKAAHKLIPIGSHQVVVNEYERQVQYYLHNKQDRFFGDDYYNAWSDIRVGGLSKNLIERTKQSQQLAMNNFEAFRQKRIQEIEAEVQELEAAANQAIMARQESEEVTRYKALTDEKLVLQDSADYYEYAVKMGVFSDYRHVIVRPYDFDNENNQKHVNFVTEKMEPMLRARYNMSQSLAFGLTQGTSLPKGQFETEQYISTLRTGIVQYAPLLQNNHFWEDGNFLDSTRENEHLDAAFTHIYKPFASVQGKAQAYRDAMNALRSSPEWQALRRYNMAQALEDQDYRKYNAWQMNDFDALCRYAEHSGEYKPLDTARTNVLFNQGLDATTLRSKIIPALQELHESEHMYDYLRRTIDFYNQRQQENPAEIQAVIARHPNIDSDMQYQVNVRLEENTQMDNLKHDTLIGLTRRLSSKMDISENIWEYGKIAAISTIGTVVGGTILGVGFSLGRTAGFATSMGLYGTDAVLGCFETVGKWQKDMASTMNDTWFNSALSNVINASIRRDIETYHEAYKQREAYAVEQINAIPTEDFDNALVHMMNNADMMDQPVLRLVYGARRLASLSSEELDQLYLEHQEERLANEMARKKNPNDLDLIAEEQDLVEREIMFTCIKTGRYFAVAKQGAEILENQGYYDRQALFKEYNTGDTAALLALENSMNACQSAEFEAAMRAEIVHNWNRNGRPIEQPSEELIQSYTEMANETISEDYKEWFNFLETHSEDYMYTSTEELTTPDINQTRDVRRQLEAFKIPDTELTDLNLTQTDALSK